jgi:hypothetical protein
VRCASARMSQHRCELQPRCDSAAQLTAFEVWLEHGSEKKKPPEQLPIVLQVLLSQVSMPSPTNTRKVRLPTPSVRCTAPGDMHLCQSMYTSFGGEVVCGVIYSGSCTRLVWHTSVLLGASTPRVAAARPVLGHGALGSQFSTICRNLPVRHSAISLHSLRCLGCLLAFTCTACMVRMHAHCSKSSAVVGTFASRLHECAAARHASCAALSCDYRNRSRAYKPQ